MEYAEFTCEIINETEGGLLVKIDGRTHWVQRAFMDSESSRLHVSFPPNAAVTIRVAVAHAEALGVLPCI